MNLNCGCMRALLLFGAALFSGSEAVAATYTYTYIGNNFLAADILDATPPSGTYTTSMRVSGFFTLASPLPANLPPSIFNDTVPLSFSFSDGRNQITDTHNTDFGFDIATDSLGNISGWAISMSVQPPLANQTFFITTRFDPTGTLFGTFDEGRIDDPSGVGLTDLASVGNMPGTWNVSVTDIATPLPATLPLFGGGLGALALLGWCGRREVPKHTRVLRLLCPRI